MKNEEGAILKSKNERKTLLCIITGKKNKEQHIGGELERSWRV